jgi:hypothetical protein
MSRAAARISAVQTESSVLLTTPTEWRAERRTACKRSARTHAHLDAVGQLQVELAVADTGILLVQLELVPALSMRLEQQG